MFFRETRKTEEDIRRMFCEAREKMKKRITLKKKSDPGQFAKQCTVKGIEFPHALCDTRALVSILPRVMADHLGLQVEPSKEIFTFVDCCQRSSRGIVRDLEVHIVGAVYNLQSNQLCLTLIDPHTHYNPIPIKKPQTSSRRINDPGHIAACHCGSYSHQKSTDTPREESVDSRPEDWKNDYYNPTMAAHTRHYMHTKEYDEDYEKERAIDWVDDHHHESYAVETVIHEPGVDEPHEGFTYEELLNMQRHDKADQQQAEATERTPLSHPIDITNRPSIDETPPSSIDIRRKPPSPKYRHPTRPSIDVGVPLSIDRRPEFGRRAFDLFGTRKLYWEENDEYGVYRDDQGCARDVDGHIINVSKDDIRKLMERALIDEHSYICLPEHASSFTQTKLVPEIYTKDEIDEMFYGDCGAQEKYEGDFQMKLDGVYYPLNDSISWLTTCMEEMRQDMAKIQHAADKHRPASIDRHHSTSIDDDPRNSHPMQSQPYFHTRAEIDQLIEAIQRELVEIQSYIARRPEASASIDRRYNKSTDTHRQTSVDDATNQGRLVPKVTSHNQGEEISADTYATLRRHQFNLESLGDRLQKMENTTATMKEKWRRGDEAMRYFTNSTKDTKVDQPVNYSHLLRLFEGTKADLQH
ncbi:hypothetical protein F2Q69_00029888 [Brassica cretica]|uniref:Uncharacterized protein n=1 Tax=Brassica cretica TaxID=69181 RepID=A0A8S9RZ52_BRACR|nr:hypothetical protein F2Q69_00029888 [Brassica cretica]